MKSRNIVIVIAAAILCICSEAFAQTVGLFLNDTGSYNGYTLFSPIAYANSYLIDNCGKKVHEWTGTGQAGVIAYLLPNGNLLRTERVAGTPFSTGGGVGGTLMILDAASNVLWSYNFLSSTHQQHHDVHYMPNGNILVLSWEAKTQADAIQSGRDPALVPSSGLWSEMITEIQPVGTNSINVVWEWHLWDHVVQDFDNTKSNYGNVANSQGLLDINYNNSSNNTDWIHANGIDFNPSLDQIMISSLNMDEFWIIDHSTTTAEAATHSGGVRGKGGDFLYRWGNPEAYRQGTVSDKKFFDLHNAHWADSSNRFQNMIVVYNNGRGRGYSSVEVIDPAIDAFGNYPYTSGTAFAPSNFFYSYGNGTTANFFSLRISGAQIQPNGNILICVGNSGRFIEIDSLENLVWEYKNPVNGTGPVSQGTNILNNNVFRAYRYPVNYSGLPPGLVPGNPIELNPLNYTCIITPEVTGISESHKTNGLIYPNPFTQFIKIEWPQNSEVARVYSVNGEKIIDIMKGSEQINALNKLAAGIYFVKFDVGYFIRLIKLPE
jgi:hypothetical protein